MPPSSRLPFQEWACRRICSAIAEWRQGGEVMNQSRFASIKKDNAVHVHRGYPKYSLIIASETHIFIPVVVVQYTVVTASNLNPSNWYSFIIEGQALTKGALAPHTLE